MDVVNIHSKSFTVDAKHLGALIDSLASTEDMLWPGEAWPAIRFDRPLGIGARGGHGPIRYSVTEYEPGRRVRFVFHGPVGFDGFHELRLESGENGSCRLVHELRMRTHGRASLTWPLIFRPLHDALIEDALARAAGSLGTEVKAPQWSWYVRVLRSVLPLILPQQRRKSR
jgi:hypothetical protein